MKFQIIKTASGWYWRIRADNGRVLCHSETYKTKRSAQNGAHLIWQEMTLRYPLEYLP